MKRTKLSLHVLALLALAVVVIARVESAASHVLLPSDEEIEQTAAAPQQSAQKAAPQPSAQKNATRNLAIFIFDGVQIIDYTGPFEVLGHAWLNDQPMFNIYTVAARPDAITTNMGMTVVPKYTFDNMPKADVLVLPGGGVRRSMEDPKVIKWVQDTSANAEYVMSVCNGAFFLGRAGLLDGLTATTFHGLLDELKTIAPKAKVVNDQRFVDNGKIITTAGLSSGMDGALHLIEKLAGYGKAQEVALGLEYNWQPELNYARASFADRHLRKALGAEGFKLPEGTGWLVLKQRGGKDDWEKNWEVKLSTTAPELLKLIDAKLAEGWTKLSVSNAAGGVRSVWKFTDEDGKPWSAVANVQPSEGAVGTFRLSIKLARGDSAARAGLE
jgi:putative intracellular protease/amidase